MLVWLFSPQLPAGFPPSGPGCFWIESPYQLVIGYHQLAFLNLVHKNLSLDPNSLIMLSTKSTIIQKLKLLKSVVQNSFQNIAHLLERKKWPLMEGGKRGICMSLFRTAGPVWDYFCLQIYPESVIAVNRQPYLSVKIQKFISLWAVIYNTAVFTMVFTTLFVCIFSTMNAMQNTYIQYMQSRWYRPQ